MERLNEQLCEQVNKQTSRGVAEPVAWQPVAWRFTLLCMQGDGVIIP